MRDVPIEMVPSARKRLGAYYTPASMVDFLITQVVIPSFDGLVAPPTIIDPACGDGRLLEAAGVALATRFGVDPRPYLVGAEIDPVAARETAARLGVRVVEGDARSIDLGGPFDVVIGNPPYLSQLASATARGGRSALGGGLYADVAAEFLALSLRLARREGGRIGLVLPVSILATRDVGPVRVAVEQAAALDVFWWADESMFDAEVRTCIVGLVMGVGRRRPVRRCFGRGFEAVTTVSIPSADGARSGTDTWSWLVADVAGVPSLDEMVVADRLGDLAVVTADFRDQYYGLVGAVSDEGDGPWLVTSGLIDAGRCRWGERPVRFAKQRFGAPRVDVDALTPKLQAWAARRLVPKVLVASQTKVIEAVVDEQGEWLPSVPVISVMPHVVDDLWRSAAVLTSPVASAWLAHRRLGSGLSASAVRVSAADLAQVPLPTDDDAWERATAALRDGDVVGCGRAMVEAYGLADRVDLCEWWESLLGPGISARTYPETG